MRNFTALLFILLFISDFAIGQNSPYKRLYNQETLPADFTTPSYEKYLQNLKKSNGHDHNSFDNEKDREKFYMELTYTVDQLLKSGYILYNDPIGKYVNKVLDVIINNNPVLKEKSPRAYILRSTAVNAFAVDQGIVFVSIGLLSQLENEAQLALILAHELVHVQENHGLDKFLETIKVDQKISDRNGSNRKQLDLAALEKNRYSREQEMEADDKGLSYFLNTDYSFESIQRVFDVLRYSYLPYDEIPFNKNILEKISVQLPEDLLLEEVQAINPAEEDEDQSTHPALSKRTANFSQRLNGMDGKGKKDYLISKEIFQDAQLRSRVELARLFVNRQALVEAIYSSFLMSEIYGENDFTQEIIGNALYGLTKFKNNNEAEALNVPHYTKIEGESQQAYHLINKLDKEQLNILAIAYNYDRFQQQPNNKVLRARVVDLFAELYMRHEINSLSQFYFLENSSKQDTTENVDNKVVSKIDKIKKKEKKVSETGWENLAFSDVLNDSDFRNIADEGFKLGKSLEEELDYYSRDTYSGRKNSKDYQRKVEKKGRSLGINNILIINPRFYHLEGSSSKPSIKYVESEERLGSLQKIIKTSAEKHEVKIDFLENDKLKQNDADLLNDLLEVNEWMENQYDTQGFLTLGYNQDRMVEIADRFNTNYIMSVDVISRRPNSFLSRVFNKKIKSFISVTVFDVRDGRRSYIKLDFRPNYMDDIFLKSELYDVFYQISKKS